MNGAQQGLDLITRALVDPGDAVVVETPSYAGALSLLRAHRARLVGVPLDGERPRGPRPSSARSLEKPKFVYTIPDFQNPTGLLASPSRRAEIARLAAAAGVLLVEDAFDADLLVEGELPPPLAALAPGPRGPPRHDLEGALPGRARRLDLGAAENSCTGSRRSSASAS